MINQINYIFSNNYDPARNLALEEYLLHNVKEDQCIMYLWQNEKTVVIGRNQNPLKECKLKELEEDGGKLVRRLSGGGAVFHDLGNLNFTFLVSKENYDLDKQLDVILKAVADFGIPAEKTGRNDITVDGRKFSGNAFYEAGNQAYHHGTILIDVDMQKLSQYLNVSKDKLVSKGVESVKSRVINLKECNNELNIDQMKSKLIEAFSKVYGYEPTAYNESELDENEIKKLSEKYSSWEWTFGKKLEFDYSFGKRYPWGNVDFHVNVNKGIVKECKLYSDAMDTWLIECIPSYLINQPFEHNSILLKLKEIPLKDSLMETMITDIINLVNEEGI
jgi:lipoate-protein ligase A